MCLAHWRGHDSDDVYVKGVYDCLLIVTVCLMCASATDLNSSSSFSLRRRDVIRLTCDSCIGQYINTCYIFRNIDLETFQIYSSLFAVMVETVQQYNEQYI